MGIGKKFALAMGLAAMAATAIAPAAIAGVVGSNHDMILKYTLAGAARRAGTCSFCHIPHKAGGDKLWASSYTTGTGWRAETISQLCYTCHGTGTGYNEALELNPFGSTNKHGRTTATLISSGDIGALPGTVEVTASGDLKCTSCHDVHNNDSRPFLRYSGAGTFNFQAHCETCHLHRANATGQGTTNIVASAAAGNFSQHPTDKAISASNSHLEAFVAVAAEFNQVPGVQGAAQSFWNLGGHRNDGLATGNMTCATCHAVHGNETAVFTAADGNTQVGAEVTGYNALLVRNGAQTTVSAAICTGCHANVMVAGVGAGPGSTGLSHPIDTVRSTWSVTGILGPGAPVGSYWGTNSGDVIVCESCHDMHYGSSSTSLLRGPIDGPNVLTSNSNCDACHSTSTMPNHHPAGVVYTGIAGPLTRTTAFNWGTYAFGTAGPAYSFATGGVMTCGTCHGGSGAHNIPGAFPGLTSVNSCSDMCVDCHTTNPSTYTATTGIATQSTTVTTQASHFVGTLSTAGYVRTAVWGSTGLASKYCTTNTQIICESCHTLKINTGTLPGPTSSNSTAVGTAVRANVRLLLERNGNLNSVYNTSITGTNADMCTGCHGGSPTGGTAQAGTATHPTISMGMTVAATAPIQAKIVAGTVSLNGANMVNCESCHRPHDAAAGSGALILEAAGTASTKTAGPGAVAFDRATGNGGANYTEEATFCNYCHSY